MPGPWWIASRGPGSHGCCCDSLARLSAAHHRTFHFKGCQQYYQAREIGGGAASNVQHMASGRMQAVLFMGQALEMIRKER